MRYSLEVVVSVPEHWTVGDLLFHRNDSSSCASNGVQEIVEHNERLEKDGQCACPTWKAEFVREAGEQDDLMTDDEVLA
jgi:hypothetical protein